MDQRRSDATVTRRRRAAAEAENALPTPEPTTVAPAARSSRAVQTLAPIAAPAAKVAEPSLDQDALQELTQMGADDFARLMADAVGAKRPRHRVGDSVTGRVSGLGDKDLWIDLGDKSEALMAMDEVRGPDGRPTVAVGQPISARVLSMHGGEIRLSRRLSGTSARNALEDAMNARMPVEGRVTERNAGGYVVDVGGTRAFCPSSQIARHPGVDPDAWVGQTLTFRVQQIRGSEAVVSHRVIEEAELRERAEKFWAEVRPGQERDGTVTSLQSYGAFIDLGGVEGLVHLSKITWDEIEKPADVLKVGESVRVQVLEVDAARQRLSLSIRDANGPAPKKSSGGLGTMADLFQRARGR